LNERTIALLGEDKFTKIQNSRVLVVGLGGVGGYCLEALVRSGVGTIGLCDFDIADETNLNRQILVTKDGLGKKKVDLAFDRAKSINPDIKLIKYDIKLNPENINQLNLDSWDFVAECIDDTSAKLALIKAASNKIVCCMGTGNKINPFSFEISRIDKTEGDPLARSIRRSLKDVGIRNIPVLYSKETPYAETQKPIPTISYMPGVAGLEMASYVIGKLLEI